MSQVKRQFSSRRINHFIGVSRFIVARLEKEGITKEKMSVVYNAIDLKRFTPATDEAEKTELKQRLFGLSRGQAVATYAGQMIEEKGLKYYLESVDELLKRRDDIFFVFVGAGNLAGLLIERIERSKGERVRFLGLRDDVEMILKASDFVIVPSVWEEAFGLIAAEASACGVPVIASRIGGLPEVVLDNETGILVKPANIEELIKAIEILSDNQVLRRQFSISARKHAEKHFDMESIASRTLDIYQRILGDR